MSSIKFKPDFILPRLIFTLTPRDASEFVKAELSQKVVAESADYNLEMAYSSVKPEPVIAEDEKFVTVLIGAPIIGECIEPSSAIREFFSGKDIDLNKIKDLNGEFLVFRFDKKTSELSVINDRFTSFPLFYYYNQNNGSFYASIYFSDLWEFLKKNNCLEIDQNAFFEFYWLQRLLGTKTYAKNAFFLEDASLLKLKDKNISITRYWQRDYAKSQKSLSVHAQMMCDLVRQSVRRKASDDKRFGHFLSGGMDSRSVFAAFEDKLPVCFTATFGENRELKTAAKIAAAKGATHIPLELAEQHLGQIFRHSTKVIGGMYNFDHGLFYGFNQAVQENADVCFHGHGFDYMFQGMYIPKRNVKVAGRQLYVNFARELPEDLVSYFIDNVSYRIKRADIWAYVNPEKEKELREFQRASVDAVLNDGKKLTENKNDLWEYLTFHHISRHYSYPNHASIATFAEQRTVSFDNELFDLYLSLPMKHRINGKIEKACLKRLNPEIAKIWSANTNLPVTASCWTQTVYQLAGFIKRRFIPEEQKPEWQERTWPERGDALRQDELLKKAVKDLCSSDTLQKFNFLNTKKIKDEIPRFLDGEDVPGISGDLVQTLLTMGTFIEQ